MPAARITREIYDRLVAGFTVHPGKPVQAAKLANADRVVAWRAWTTGWSSLGLPPIREQFPEPVDNSPEAVAARVVAEAAMTAEGAARRLVEDATAKAVLEATAEEAARAARERIRRESQEAREQAEARADARDDAVTVLDEERKLRKGGRAVAGQNVIASARWGRAHARLAEALLTKVEAEIPQLTAMEIAELSRVMAQVDKARLGLMREIIEMERLHRGDPSILVGVTPTEMSVDEAIKELEEANADLMRFRRQTMVVIDGEGGRTVGPLLDVTPSQ